MFPGTCADGVPKQAMENTPPVRSGTAESAQDDVQALTCHGLYLDIRGTADVKNVSLVQQIGDYHKSNYNLFKFCATGYCILDFRKLL